MADNLKPEDLKHFRESEHFEAQTRKELAEARKVELEVAEAERKAEEAAASNDRHYVYQFESAVRSTDGLRATLDKWHRLHPAAPWTIIWNSPGGSVIDGYALFDHIAAYSTRGGGPHHITGIVRGYAASMAGILLQASDHRVVGPESYLMLHKVSTVAGGSLDDIEDEVAFLKMLQARTEDLFYKRSGGKLTKATLRRKYARKDWWVPSDEAVKYGLADEIG